MKKTIVVGLIALGLSACSSEKTSEDVRLQQAWKNCIQTAQGSPEKLKACEGMPESVEQAQQRESATPQETIPPLEYQQCIQARKSGNDQEVERVCDKIWQESHQITP